MSHAEAFNKPPGLSAQKRIDKNHSILYFKDIQNVIV